MRRREAMALIGSAALATPRVVHAQGEPVLGFLSGRSRAETAAVLAEFRRGLAESGYAEGQNLEIEYRWAEGRYDRLPALAAELVARRVAVITATGGSVAAVAAKAATSTIPIVFLGGGGDPVKAGLVASLNRPGGNVTGVSLFIAELAAKRLELLRELVPSLTRIAILINPNNPNADVEGRDVQARAAALGLEAHVVQAAAEGEFEPAFAALAARGTGGLLLANDPFLIDLRDGLVAMAAKHALPTVYFTRDFVEAGGLMSYGTSIGDGYHKVGLYAGQILKGATPADLPVLQPTRFELVINLNAAKALGLAVPLTLQAQADEVIE